jgi:hypothetical protein
VPMMWKNENYNNDRPACKKEYECKYPAKIYGLSPGNYRDNILDLIINGPCKNNML